MPILHRGLTTLFLLAAALLAACNSNGSSDGPGNGDPPEVAGAPTEGLPEIGGRQDISDSEMPYYRESKSIYMGGNLPAWEKRLNEILDTKGTAGQEFLIVLLAVAEQDPRTTEERQEAARKELGNVLRAIAGGKDDWGCWYFMHMFLKADVTFANSVFVPTCIQTGPALYPYVRRLLNEDGLKEIQRGSAYQALGGTRGPNSVRDLAAFSASHSGSDGAILRASCMTGLGLTTSEEALDPLSKGFDDPEAFVREEALEATTRINSPKAIPVLIKALKLAKKYREKNAVLERLRALAGDSGKKIGESPAAWEEWWRSNGGNLK